MPSISIKQTAPGEASVILDGTEINRGLRGVDVEMRSDCLPRVTLDVLVIEDFRIDTEHVILDIPEDTAAVLKALGWTPPDDIQDSRPLDVTAALKAAETGTVVTS